MTSSASYRWARYLAEGHGDASLHERMRAALTVASVRMSTAVRCLARMTAHRERRERAYALAARELRDIATRCADAGAIG